MPANYDGIVQPLLSFSTTGSKWVAPMYNKAPAENASINPKACGQCFE